MALTIVQICNLALGHVGAGEITSLSDNTKGAKLCNALYVPCRDEVLASAYWNFALFRLTLAEVVAEPLWGYSYSYQLPSDCLRVRRTQVHGEEWAVEGDTLYSQNSTCQIQYIKRITDTAKYRPEFVTALAYRIALDLAFPMVQSNTLRDSIEARYDKCIANAKSSDGQEGKLPPIITPTLLQSRVIRGGTTDAYLRGERDV